MPIKILLVVGTRPNYIKIKQFKKIAEQNFESRFDIKIVHTGQHFDASMADIFFKQLQIQPDFFLNIPVASPAVQMGEIMVRLERVINDEFYPDLILVPGDVNSTLAAALTANKMSIALGHLESGLRSFDRTMPEEINRILVDEISDYHFVTEKSGVVNLLKEGKNQETIFFVGNTMIDTLVAFENDIKSRTNLQDLRIEPNEFILITLHRPATVDNKNGLSSVFELLEKLTDKATVVFPMHPRTRKNIDKFGLEERLNQIENLEILGPSDYFSFQNLIRQSRVVLTDSGGIQEETTFKQIPCFTLRPNTERPSTIIEGSNTLIDFDSDSILTYIDSVFSRNYKDSSIPKYWDGEATQRILKIISKLQLSAV